MRRIFSLLLLLTITIPLLAAEPHHKIVQVFPKSASEITRLAEMGLDIVRVVPGEFVEIVANPSDFQAIKSAGFDYKIEIEDWEQHYITNVNPNQDEMGGFLTYTELVARLNQIHTAYPNITTAPYSIGQSWEGRDLWVIKVSDNPSVDEDEPEVWYDGLHHAREPIGMQLLIYFIEYLCQNYGMNAQVDSVINYRELFVLPCSNPDGYCYNEQIAPTGGGQWRKNRRNNGGSYGVDLNRNYAWQWGYDNVGSSGSPSSDTYRGPSPASEPETQAICNYINTRHIALSHSYHSYGDMCLIPYGGEYNGFPPDYDDFLTVGNQISSYNGYTVGAPWQLLYNVNGGNIDWHYAQTDEHYKIMAFSQEVGAAFWPSPNLIQGLCQENLAPNIYSALVAAEFAPPPVYLTMAELEVDDSTGNNNGTADPGEIIGLSVTLRNTGYSSAQNSTAVLQSPDPYLTITSANSTYPSIPSLGTGENLTPFNVTVSNSCPLGYYADLLLIVTPSGGTADTVRFEILVGDPANNPTGPDAYGYLAYDQGDGHPMGAFEWIEIDPAFGGSGTNMNFTSDDQTIQRTLPFSFTYYGAAFTQISVCSNGWIAMGSTTSIDYSNSQIPNNDGPPNMIAPFWDDLSPQASGEILYYSDEANHRYIVEYSRVRQYSPTTAFETFEVIFYDPAFYTTSTGDGIIKFLYHTVTDPTSCTVGIENSAQTIGLQVLYNQTYGPNSHPIDDQSTIVFTTGTGAPQVEISLDALLPIVIPAAGGSFNYSVRLENISTTPAIVDVWLQVTLPNGSPYPLFSRQNINLGAGVVLLRNMSLNVPGSAPAGNYTYHSYAGNYPSTIWSQDSFPFSKAGVDASAGGNWLVSGWDDESSTTKAPTEFSLKQNYPNPFNPETSIEFSLPEASKVTLTVYNISGQVVAALLDGNLNAGNHSLMWNAQNIPSGVYFYSIQAGDFHDVKKCILLK